MTPVVLAAHAWPTNGHLIADVARLGHITSTDRILDVTWGRGVWWKQWKPDVLIANNFDDGGYDFRKIPYPDNAFDVVAFDPPYVSIGGRKGSKMGELHDRFGLIDTPTTPLGLQVVIFEGLDECVRVAERIVLVKCQSYVSSGHLWLGTHHTLTHALSLGCELIDELVRTQPNSRPQPEGRTRAGADGERIPTTQQHARRNCSTLFVLRVPR